MYTELYNRIFALYTSFAEEFNKQCSNIPLLCNISEQLYYMHKKFITFGRRYNKILSYQFYNDRIISFIKITLGLINDTSYFNTIFNKSINNAIDKWNELLCMHESIRMSKNLKSSFG